MRPQLQRHGMELAYSFCGVILAGAVISGLLTSDPRWMNWHFSRLGEGGMSSSNVFNITLFISSIIMLALSTSLNDNLLHIAKNSSKDITKARMIIYRAFIAVTICLVGLAFFPFDRFPVIHNIFGYSMFFIFLFLCVIAPRILPFLSRKIRIYGWSVIFLAIICYFLFLGLGIISLLTVEITMFVFIYGWLLLFIKGIYIETSKRK